MGCGSSAVEVDTNPITYTPQQNEPTKKDEIQPNQNLEKEIKQEIKQEIKPEIKQEIKQEIKEKEQIKPKKE